MIIVHILLSILYIGIPLLFVLYYRTYRISNSIDKYFFILGFLTKIFGATCAVLIYKLYYGGGDTTEYCRGGVLLFDYVIDHLDQLPQILASEDLRNFNELSFIQYNVKFDYWYAKPTYTMTKIALIINTFTLNSFFLTSILCSYFSFFCSWKFYRFFGENTETNKKLAGYAIFLMPSVIFWGSGLFKDTFTLGGLYLLIIGLVNVFGHSRYKISNVLYIIIGAYLLFSIRSFFLMASFPFVLLWIISLRFYSIPRLSIKIFITPFFVVIAGISMAASLQYLTIFFQELSIEKLVDTSKGFQSWHASLQGSSYSLGEIDYTVNGLIRKIPASIVVTFFRPFIWEAKKPIVLISSFQSLIFLFITIYAIFKMRIVYFFTSFFSSPQAIALMGFSLFYGIVVGFTSYNFGALDRYKIPCLSTYMLALVFAWEKYKINHES